MARNHKKSDMKKPSGGKRPSTQKPLRRDTRREQSQDDLRPRERELREDRLEGRHAVEEALKAGQPIDKLWVMLAEDGTIPGPLQPLVRQAKAAGAVIVEAPRPSLDRLSQTGIHQGIIAQIPAVEYAEPEDMLALAEKKGEEPFLILLDQIHDSHNLGAILRVAEGVGAHGVIIPKHRALGMDAVAVRASAGAASHVMIARVTNLGQCMRDLKDKGVWIAGADADGENALTSGNLHGPMALVIGNEADGMSKLVRDTCDFIISIPMLGQVSSLNASVACGILAYRIRQVRDAAN